MTTSKALLVTAWIALTTDLTGCGSPPRDQAEIGSVLPIRVGIYIDESQTCADPANAGLLSYDGEGLNGAHTHDCRMIVESYQGKLFAYSLQCVDAGIGDGPIISEKRAHDHRKRQTLLAAPERWKDGFYLLRPFSAATRNTCASTERAPARPLALPDT